MILLVSYDLKQPGRNYEPLYNALKSAETWWHYLESTWLIKTTESVKTWQDRLLSVIDTNDRLIVIRLSTTPETGGWLPQNAWDWIKQNQY